MSTIRTVVSSATNRYLSGPSDDEVALYLNHGWQGCADPAATGERAGRPGGQGRNWRPATLERPPRDGAAIHWLKRAFYLPAVSLPSYELDVQSVNGAARAYLNGTAWTRHASALRPDHDNLLVLRLEGPDASVRLPVRLSIRRRMNADPGFGRMSRRFAAVVPPAPRPVLFDLTGRVIRMRQGALHIPLDRRCLAVHCLGHVNPEWAGRCDSGLMLTYAAEDQEGLRLLHGESIGSPHVPRPLPAAECHVVQANLPGCEVDSFVGAYDVVLANRRPAHLVQELVIDKWLATQSSTMTIGAITLETGRGFEPVDLAPYANADQDLPLARGRVALGFAARRSCVVVADAVPFLTASDGDIASGRGAAEFRGGFTGARLHLLGAVAENLSDPGRLDPKFNPFIGDTLGHVEAYYAGGGVDRFPIVLGVNGSLGPAWADVARAEPFRGDERAWNALVDAQAWHRAGSHPHRWGHIAFPLRRRRVSRLVIRRNPAFIARLVFSAVTVEGGDGRGLAPLPQVTPRDSAPKTVPPALSSAELTGPRLARRVGPLQRCLYRSAAQLPSRLRPTRPPDYEGPEVAFHGRGPWAAMLCNTWAHGLRDTVAKLLPAVDTSATSTPRAPVYCAHGIWRLDVGRGNYPGYDSYWSRDHGRTALERYELGLRHWSPREIEHTDRAARVLAVPPHQTQETDRPRTNNLLNTYAYSWHLTTTTGQRVHGNPENDGHGLVMLMRYHHWLHSGRSRAWLREHWPGTEESAEWVCWQLDHPLHPTPEQVRRSGTWNQRHLRLQQPPDVLWSSTECSGYRDYEIYTNSCCLAGLRSAVRLARAAGHRRQADRWEAYAERLANGMGRHLVVNAATGPVWRYSTTTVWPLYCQATGPLLLAPDVDSYDPARALSPAWLRISANTYALLRRRMPDLVVPGALGYGFGFFLQSALLLDRMADASRIAENILRVNYDGRLSPWIVSEGIVVRGDRALWYREGDLGNSVQQGEVLKGIRLMLGVDDLDPAHTRLMPRLPGWCRRLEVKDYPVMTGAGAECVEARADFAVSRQGAGWRLQARFTRAPVRLSLRLGPFAEHAVGRIRLNGRPAAGYWLRSGDGLWVWLGVPAGARETDVSVTR